MECAPRGKLRVTRQIHAIADELGITDVNPGSVGAEATREVLRGIIEPPAGLKRYGRGSDPKSTAAGGRSVSGIVLKDARDEGCLNVVHTHGAAVVLSGRYAVREGETLECYGPRRSEC